MRDLRAVLFPPILMTYFIIDFALPMALLITHFTTPNVRWLFAAVSLGHFLNYEFLHLAYLNRRQREICSRLANPRRGKNKLNGKAPNRRWRTLIWQQIQRWQQIARYFQDERCQARRADE